MFRWQASRVLFTRNRNCSNHIIPLAFCVNAIVLIPRSPRFNDVRIPDSSARFIPWVLTVISLVVDPRRQGCADRRRQTGSLCVKDLQLRPGHGHHPGQESREGVGHRSWRLGANMERWMHHPSGILGQDKAGGFRALSPWHRRYFACPCLAPFAIWKVVPKPTHLSAF